MTHQKDIYASEVISKLEEVGFKGRLVSVEHLAELKDEIEDLHSQSLLDDAILDVSGMVSRPRQKRGNSRSQLFTATPCPQTS